MLTKLHILVLLAGLMCLAGFSTHAQSNGSAVWTASFNDSIQSSPALDSDGNVYFCADNGTVYAYSPSGVKKWEFKTRSTVVASPAISADETIYIASMDLHFYALNRNGTVKWQKPLQSGITASPALAADGTIYVGTVENELIALNPDGTRKWQFLTGDTIVSSPAIGLDGTIYFGCRDNLVYALTPKGEKKWSFATNDKIHASPAIGPDGTIYIGSFDQNLYALNPDGTKKWSFDAAAPVRSSAAVGADGTIYFGTDDNHFYAVTPDGKRKWMTIVGYWVRSSPAVASDGTIYVGCYDNSFYAINADGTKRWEFSTGGYISSSPVISKSGDIYFGSWDKNFYALHGTNGPAKSSWPMFRSTADHAGRANYIAPVVAKIASTNTASETAKPIVEVKSPASNLQVFTPQITIQGTAGGNVRIARVEYQIGDANFTPALGTTNWFAQITLQGGENIINVRSIDERGNTSPVVRRVIAFSGLSRLHLEIQGKGTVTPVLTDRDLEAGRSYTLTAEPDKDSLFNGWSGDITNNAARLTFVMQPNLSLRATFLPNPYHEIQGEYNGLVFQTNSISPALAGWFNLTASAKGGCRGTMMLNGTTYPLNGQFDGLGRCVMALKRANQNPISIELRINFGRTPDLISGNVREGENKANLLGDRMVYDGKSRRSPHEGRYTLSITGREDMATEGSGYGVVTVDEKGYVKLQGALPDGSELQQETALSKEGLWPFYVPLYGGRGSLSGWIKFSPESYGDLHGALVWVKPAAPRSVLSPQGFTNQVALLGSTYTAPAGNLRVVAMTNSLVGFQGGNLPEMLVNLAKLEENNRLTVTGGDKNQLNFKINPATGQFSGKFNHPATGKSTPFEGVLLQKQNSGTGFFLGTNQSGVVFLMPGKP